MHENIYINAQNNNYQQVTDNKYKIHAIDKRGVRCIAVLTVLLSLSLLVNVVLGYKYHNTDTNQGCELVTNISSPVSNTQTTKEVNKPSVSCSDKDLLGKWVLNKDRFYVFHDEIRNWIDSRDHCQTLNGDLVIIKSKEEQDFLAQQIVKLDAPALHWIGLTDSQTEGVWLWVDNTPLNDNLSWWIFPPDNHPRDDPLGEDCAVLNGFSKGEKWGDISCSKKEKSICEIPCY
ncbi:C-type lectin domain family 6 member A-like isoform X2 [Paramisgurnus dabryanus]|uniref:C-type lectin domain family 6 member A-like isoform X2 n=1 Tax=Paramisgurnus dabryanus TaxID=90735 RepID=UPI0031F3F466